MTKKADEIDIQAIHDHDLRKILDSLGISQKIDEGVLFCKSCLQPINWDNIGGFFILNDEVFLCCDLTDCLDILERFRENADKS